MYQVIEEEKRERKKERMNGMRSIATYNTCAIPTHMHACIQTETFSASESDPKNQIPPTGGNDGNSRSNNSTRWVMKKKREQTERGGGFEQRSSKPKRNNFGGPIERALLIARKPS